MEFDLYEMEAIEGMEKVIENYRNNLVKISIGRANPALLNSVRVLYYETLTPINEMASIVSPEARQLLIKPFDLSSLKEIVAAINSSSLGINAVNEGAQARITLPEPTTERRRELVKQFGHYTEQARIGIRSIRQDVNKAIKSDEELAEDDEKKYLEDIQKIVDKFNKLIDEIAHEKEAELMTI